MKTFDTVAKLKLAKLKEGQFVETGGYYAKGDGGAARYLIVIPRSFDGYGDHELANGNIAVLQVDSDELHVYQFGARADGSTNDYDQLAAAFAASQNKRTVNLAAGKTHVTETELSLRIGSEGVKLNGNNATIKAGAVMDSIIRVGDDYPATTTTVRNQITDLTLDGNSLAKNCFKGNFMTEQYSVMQNIKTLRATSHNIYMNGCQVMKMENISSVHSGGHGFLFESCNGLTMDTYRAELAALDGVRVQTGLQGYSSGLQLYNQNVERNTGDGIHVVDTFSPVLISGGWIENGSTLGVYGNGVVVSGTAANVRVQDLGIIGGDSSNTLTAIKFDSNTVACSTKGNALQSTGGTSWIVPVDNAETGINDLSGNYIRSNGKPIGDKVFPMPVKAADHIGLTGDLSGGTAIEIPAAGSKTFTFTPSGAFTVEGGALNGGYYFIELDFFGSFVGIAECVFKRFLVSTATRDGTAFDASVTVPADYTVGDPARQAALTIAAPTIIGSTPAFSAVVSNSDDSEFTGYVVVRYMCTTGRIDLAIS